MKEYQIYAIDKHGKLNHAGPKFIRGNVTANKCKRLERAWRKWRKEYLATHPGNYPLREHHNKTVKYIMNVVGDSKRFVVNLA